MWECAGVDELLPGAVWERVPNEGGKRVLDALPSAAWKGDCLASSCHEARQLGRVLSLQHLQLVVGLLQLLKVELLRLGQTGQGQLGRVARRGGGGEDCWVAEAADDELCCCAPVAEY